VILRTGVVLDRGTPAFDRLSGLVRWGLGGRIGNGHAWFSWLHIADFLAVVRRCLDDPQISGVLHVTSPNPVRNAELMAILREARHRRFGLATPAALVRLGAIALRTDPALVLTGRRCVPGRLAEAGFPFAYPDLRAAVEAIERQR
jgi:NAD dependent epimerase/dehydratase family enzyme